MITLFVVAVTLQGLAMLVDEAWFHRRRGLPRWERIGHPLDTLTIVLCLGWLLLTHPDSPSALPIYVGLAIASTLFVTKDEPIHVKVCGAGEHWLHSILFVLHPIVLAAFGIVWRAGHRELLIVQLAITVAFLVYQVIYWNVLARPRAATPAVNNAWYADLGARWYTAEDTPIALLRAESRHRNPWIAEHIARQLGGRRATVLDLGCGAGFLANDLGERGHRVVGIDSTPSNLDVARRYDRTGDVVYCAGDARALPFADGCFDVVCAMDLLEHVEDPARVIAEASRVLAPSGLLFFHTFNRTWQAKLVVIKGVEWFVSNTPKDLHVLRLFITPAELTEMLRASACEPVELIGSRPRFRWPLWRMLATGKVGDDFEFTSSRSTKLGFTGVARKASAVREPALGVAEVSVQLGLTVAPQPGFSREQPRQADDVQPQPRGYLRALPIVDRLE